MRKTILTFGLISGAVSALMMAITIPFTERIGFDKGAVIGYTGIVLSFLLVYFGIRSYRDQVGKGYITFSKAFVVGLGITVISCMFYVAAWEVIYFNFMPDFTEKYSAHVIESARAAGASDAAILKKQQEMKDFKEMYANPFYNVAMTFVEPFPVGLLITLISAAVLKKNPALAQSAAPAP